MRVLLDTSVLVWLHDGNSKIGQKALKVLEDPANVVFASHFSIFEIVIKATLGKIRYNESQIENLRKMGIELLPPAVEHLSNYKIWIPDHRDPFDNILITTAVLENCVFMTSDAHILNGNLKSPKILSAKQ